VSNVRRSSITVILAIVLTLATTRSASADRVDDLCRSLTTDPSWRVRLQAVVVLGKVKDARAVPSLLRALDDENETVRGLAAQVLGELGNASTLAALQRAHTSDASAFVRDKAGLAVTRLQQAQAAARASSGAASKLHVEIGGIGVKPRNVSPELAVRLRQFIVRELEKTPGLTLEGKPITGFLIDSSITEVSRKTTSDSVEITCEISMIVGRLPSRSMVMMTSGGATVQAPKLGMRPEKEKALQIDALEGAVEGAHQNLLSFLKTQQKM
jgi:hypothetical protein